MAGDQGFEPRLTDPESVVLPLDESPVGLILKATEFSKRAECSGSENIR